MLTFFGDTTIKGVVDNESVLFAKNEEFPLIIIECSFLYDSELERSKKKKHIHFRSLEPFIAKYPQTTFMLIHFSLVYSEQ